MTSDACGRVQACKVTKMPCSAVHHVISYMCWQSGKLGFVQIAIRKSKVLCCSPHSITLSYVLGPRQTSDSCDLAHLVLPSAATSVLTTLLLSSPHSCLLANLKPTLTDINTGIKVSNIQFKEQYEQQLTQLHCVLGPRHTSDSCSRVHLVLPSPATSVLTTQLPVV